MNNQECLILRINLFNYYEEVSDFELNSEFLKRFVESEEEVVKHGVIFTNYDDINSKLNKKDLD